MRRQFNQQILPKAPPPKGKNYSKHIYGTKFNQWFRSKIKDLNMTIPEFAKTSKFSESAIRRWRKWSEPREYNQKKIAKVLSKQGLGSYDDILATIQRLCDDKRNVHKN